MSSTRRLSAEEFVEAWQSSSSMQSACQIALRWWQETADPTGEDELESCQLVTADDVLRETEGK